jgi:Uma2 family endonuclease
MTIEEYLAAEEPREDRHELFDGEMVPMKPSNAGHSLMVTNIAVAIRGAKQGSGCVTFGPNLKVCIDETRLIAYPDVTVVCGPPAFQDSGRQIVSNPTVLVEVISPSSEDYDRGVKGTLYRFVPSLREFLLVDQIRTSVEHFQRLPDGTWQIIHHQDMDSTVDLQSIGVELPIALIYEDLGKY